MLNLFGAFVVPGVEHVTLFPDDQDDQLFYMLAELPSIVRAADGGPMFSLVVYTRDQPALTQAAGVQISGEDNEAGIVSLTADLSVSEGDQAKIRAYLQGQHDGLRPVFDGPGQFHFASVATLGADRPITLAYPVWVDASVSFCLIPADGTSYIKAAETTYGPSLLGANTATYQASLDQAGAELIRAMIEQGLTPGSVNYSVQFMARIPGLRIHVTGSASDVYQDLKRQCRVVTWRGVNYYSFPLLGGIDDLRSKVASLTIDIERVDWPGAASDPEASQIESKLTDLAFMVIQAYVQSQFFSTAFTTGLQANPSGATGDPLGGVEPPPADGPWLKSPGQAMQGQLDFSASYDMSLPVMKSPNGSLLAILSPDEIKRHIILANLSQPLFRILDVTVLANADFERDPIAEVLVFLDYHQQDDITGVPIVQTQECVFSTGKEIFRFQTPMAMDQNGMPKDIYTYHSQIAYKTGQPPDPTPDKQTRERALVIGYSELSAVRVQAIWGVIPTDVVQRAQIHFTYPGLSTTTAQKDIVLAPDHTSDFWFTYTGSGASAQYQYQVSLFLTDGQRLDLPVQTGIANTLILNSPFQGMLSVTFTPQGSFPPIASIVVSTLYQDTDAQYLVQDTHTFTSLGSSWTWQVRLLAATKRGFDYKVDVTYADGSVDESVWTTSTDPVVVVGSTARAILEVNVIAALLDFQKWKLVIVRLEYQDAANQIDESQVFQITSTNAGQSLIWKTPLKDPTLKTYTYEIDAYGVDSANDRVIGPTQADSQVLVLQV
jgi:hypothetical protein